MHQTVDAALRGAVRPMTIAKIYPAGSNHSGLAQSSSESAAAGPLSRGQGAAAEAGSTPGTVTTPTSGDSGVEAAKALWQSVQPKFRGLFTVGELGTWIQHIRVVDACPRTVVLRGGSSYAATRIRTQFLARLQDRWSSIDPLNRTLIVDLGDAQAATAPSHKSQPPAAVTPLASGPDQAGFHPHAAFSVEDCNGLESSPQGASAPHRMDNFETGPSNELAHALARHVVAIPTGGELTYFHGQHGTGKTHLLEAIRHALGLTRSDLRVMLVPAQNFLSTFVSMVRENKGGQFASAFNAADVLLLDDINMLAGKKATEEELEQTIRRLQRMGRKIVLTGDVPADRLQFMTSGVPSLLKASYHAQLDLPDLGLRRKIAQREVSELAKASPGFELDGRSLDMIAARVIGSGREVKGAIRQVYLRSYLLGKEADMNAVLETISIKSAIQPKSLTVERIKRGICAYFELTQDDLVSATRRRTVARPRQIAMYLCRKYTERSLPDIGRRFGNRDHATVIHAVKTIENLIQRDASIAADVDAVTEKLASGQLGH